MADVKRNRENKVTELAERSGRGRLRKKRRKRKGLRLFFVIAVPLIILSAAIYCSVSFFFKVEQITVTGESRYAAEEIIELSEIVTGENLVFLDKKAAERRVEKGMPYLGKVTVKKSLPSKIEIFVEETYPAKIVFSHEAYYFISPEDKVLERAEQPGEHKLPIYILPELEKELEPGDKLQILDEISKKIYIDITNVLVDNNILESVNVIDLSDKIALKIQIGDQYVVDLGDYLDLPKKINFAKNIMQRLEEGEKGIIDVSNDKKASFLKMDEITPLLPIE